MAVRAKFKVQRLEESLSSRGVAGAEGKTVYVPCRLTTVKLTPVYANGDPNHENNAFWNATPAGSIELGMVFSEAVAQFDLGDEFYVDFIKVGA